MERLQNQITQFLREAGLAQASRLPLAQFTVQDRLLRVRVPAYHWCRFYLKPAPELSALWHQTNTNSDGAHPRVEEGVQRFLHRLGAANLSYESSADQRSFLSPALRVWNFQHPGPKLRFGAILLINKMVEVFWHRHSPAAFCRFDNLGLQSWSSALEHQLEFDGQELGRVYNRWLHDRRKSTAIWRYTGEMGGQPLEYYRLSLDYEQAGDGKHLYCEASGQLWCPLTGRPLTPFFLT